jgi:glycosyltransferase involved in cell wall biosynthesis
LIEGNAPAGPTITAVVCTRDRPEGAQKAIRTILDNHHPAFELLVIDQSSEARTDEALAPLLRDPRVRYVRTQERGVARSRNLALRMARAGLVAYTDDDCTVPRDWLSKMEDAIASRPRVAVLYCTVAAGPHSERDGFVPQYWPRGTTVVSTFLRKCTARGIGAGMAVRGRLVLDLGGFDEMLGPGGPLRSGEDYDLSVRAILAGFEVCETDTTRVTHYGFRTWAEGRELTLRDYIGIGAAYSKPLKTGHLRFAIVPLHEIVWQVLWPMVSDVLHLRRPRGLKRLTGFFTGFTRGLRTPVDRRTLCFVERRARCDEATAPRLPP